MDTIHRVSVNSLHQKTIDLLVQLGINYDTVKLPGSNNLLYYFDIGESDPRWPAVSDLVKKSHASDVYQSIFTTEEIRSAEWSRLIPTYQQGYPYPERSWVTNPPTYDTFCRECGTFTQKEKFVLSKEPKLKYRAFFSLFWAYTVFCTPSVFQVMKANGIIGYRQEGVILHKTGNPLSTVYQLIIVKTSLPGLVPGTLMRQPCAKCGYTKYEPFRIGKMIIKRDAIPSDVDLFQTDEWFGSMHSAYREIIISNKLANLIIDNNWKGVSLKPIETI